MKKKFTLIFYECTPLVSFLQATDVFISIFSCPVSRITYQKPYGCLIFCMLLFGGLSWVV
jgi:hypothetical protein